MVLIFKFRKNMLLTANNIKIVSKMNFAAYFDVSFHTDYLFNNG